MAHIVSASYRTDIPALYAEWFLHRLVAGYALVPHPYGGVPERVSLKPEDVSAFVFWTRNVAPFMPVLDHLAKTKRPFVVQFTANGYPKELENAVIPTEVAVERITELSRRFDPRGVVWRYDPIVISDRTPISYHIEHFARMADSLAGAVDEVVTSVVNPYEKSMRRLADLGMAVDDLRPAKQQRLLRELSVLAAARGIKLTLCTQPVLIGDDLPAARCIDIARLSRVAGFGIDAPVKGNRPGCLCYAAKDIGVYDSCTQGCLYCYAVPDPDRARERRKDHNPLEESL